MRVWLCMSIAGCFCRLGCVYMLALVWTLPAESSDIGNLNVNCSSSLPRRGVALLQAEQDFTRSIAINPALTESYKRRSQVSTMR